MCKKVPGLPRKYSPPPKISKKTSRPGIVTNQNSSAPP